MNSPSRQCDFEPLEFPFTQFLYDVEAPPLMPEMATDAALMLDPMQGCGVSGETIPLVHWLKLADPFAAAAGCASMIAAGAVIVASIAASVTPRNVRRRCGNRTAMPGPPPNHAGATRAHDALGQRPIKTGSFLRANPECRKH